MTVSVEVFMTKMGHLVIMIWKQRISKEHEYSVIRLYIILVLLGIRPSGIYCYFVLPCQY